VASDADLLLECRACGHSQLALPVLRNAEFPKGPERSAFKGILAISHRLKCSACGARDVAVVEVQGEGTKRHPDTPRPPPSAPPLPPSRTKLKVNPDVGLDRSFRGIGSTKLPQHFSTDRQRFWASHLTASSSLLNPPPPPIPRRNVMEKRELPSPLPKPQLTRRLPSGASSGRYCIDCARGIPQERISAMPHVMRCVACAAKHEQTQDLRPKARSGFAGSDDEVRRMKARQWGEVVNRGKKR